MLAVEGGEAGDGGVDVPRHVVHFVVAGTGDDHAVDRVGGQVPEPLGRFVEAGAVEVFGQDRLGQELIDQVEGVEAEQQRVAPGQPAVRRVLVAAPGGALVR